MFDGSFKSSKNINLGGNVTRINRSDLLRNTQLEREKREKDRIQREKAAQILAFWRGRKLWGVEKRVFLDKLRQWTAENESTTDTSISNIAWALRVVHFATTESTSASAEVLQIVNKICTLMISQSSALASEEKTSEIGRELSQFITVVADNWLSLDQATNFLNYVLTRSPANGCLASLAAQVLIKSNFFRSIAAQSSSSKALLTETAVAAVKMLLARDKTDLRAPMTTVFQFREFRDALNRSMSSADVLNLAADLRDSAESLASAATKESLELMLPGLLELFTPSLKSGLLTDEPLYGFMACLYSLFSKSLQLSWASDDDSSTTFAAVTCVSDPNTWKLLTEAILAARNGATSDKILGIYCRLWMLTATALRSDGTEADQRRMLAIPRGALLYRLHQSLLPFFRELETTLISYKLKELITSESLAVYWDMWVCFCHVFAVCLLTMTDDEFYVQTPPNALLRDSFVPCFSTEQYVYLAQTLTRVVFPLYRQLSVPEMRECMVYSSGVSAFAIAQSLGQLLSQLRKRDSNRRFTKTAEFWSVVAENDMDRLLPQLAQAIASEADDAENSETKRRAMPLYVPMWMRRQSFLANEFMFSSALVIDSEAERWKNLLNNVPFLVPFAFRVRLFRELVVLDRKKNNLNEAIRQLTPAVRVSVRRDHIFDDGYAQLSALGSQLKGRIGINFVDSMGLEEAGIDGGGLFKEFLSCLSKEAFDPNRGLFASTSEYLLYPSPSAYAKADEQCRYLAFIGKIVGKAMYEGFLLNVTFASFFLAKWLGQRSYLDDLMSLDADFCQGLYFLKNYTGNVADLNLTFSIDEREFGVDRAVELVPGGADIPVTRENRIRYIYLCANYKLNIELETQCRAFFSGLRELINPHWIRFMSAAELSVLLSGVSQEVDIDDLQRNTVYSNGYTADHPIMKSFWHVLDSFSSQDKRAFLKFVTSSERAPLLGFSQLNPLFAILLVPDESRLPTSSTCSNLLKLPAYSSEQMLAEKLLYAIHAQAGFDLS